MGYRHETNRWIYMPQLQIGLLTNDRFESSTLFKEKDSNRWFVQDISMDPDKEYHLSISPGFWFGRSLSERFEVFVQARIDWSPVRFEIEEKTIDLFHDSAVSVKTENYQKHLISVFWGLGLMYELRL